MKGASGASLHLGGDIVAKTCSDAALQAEWYSLATTKIAKTPKVYEVNGDSYKMEYVEGHEATREPTLAVVRTLVEEVIAWKEVPSVYINPWSSYLKRLEEHVEMSGNAKAMCKAFDTVLFAKPPQPSFNHGDLTFENVLVSGDDLYLIDPNYKPNLYQSYSLDFGKMLQSTHAQYHKIFDSHHGCSLERQGKWLENWLRIHNEWDLAIINCVGHLIRLRKYQPVNKHTLVDDCITNIIEHHL